MRLLIAADRLGPLGGMERALEVLLDALIARGISVHVLARTVASTQAGYSAEQIAWADEHDEPSVSARAELQRAIDAFAPDAALAANVMDAGIVEELRAVARFAYQVHDHRPFCPNGDRRFPRTQRNCTLPLGRACVVHALTDGCAYGPRLQTLQLIRRRERLRDAIARADAVLVASQYVAERAQRSGIASSHIAELPLPLPDDAYVDTVVPGQRNAVTFAGRVVPQKGLASLIRALGTIPAERRPVVHVFGDGPALDDAVRSAADRNVTMELHGSAAPAAVRAGMDATGLVVLPSLWAEPFGLVGIEAFARGRPVVAYDVGGVRSWLHDGDNGMLVPARNEAAFGAAVDALLTDSTRRARFGGRARVAAERYRATTAVDALLATITGTQA